MIHNFRMHQRISTFYEFMVYDVFYDFMRNHKLDLIDASRAAVAQGFVQLLARGATRWHEVS